MTRYCAFCGKQIQGLHILKENGLRLHVPCAELEPIHAAIQVEKPEDHENPQVTRTHEDVKRLIDSLDQK